jgi:hypothetical protein
MVTTTSAAGTARRVSLLVDNPPRMTTRAPLTRERVLQIALGLIWLLDAALQFQPFMFTRSFVTQVIQPTTAGNPLVVAHTVNWAALVMLRHITAYNTVFATTQLVIAAGFFFRRTVKVALGASIVWALFVWWFGEGLGGVLTGSTPFAGAPGGVVLYAFIAVLIWPADRPLVDGRSSPATSGLLGATAARLLWLALWGSFTYFLLLPANRAPSALGQLFATTDGQPGWLITIMDQVSRLAGERGTEISIAVALLCALVAIGVFAASTLRLALTLAVALGLLFWVSEGLGGIFTGQGTDPNSGPLLVLLAVCFWPYRGAQTEPCGLRPPTDFSRRPSSHSSLS